MNRSTWRKFVALGVVLLLGSAAGVLAQEETGNVYAKIKDTGGNALPGVTCELSGLGAPRMQVSNAAGEVRWLGLDPGNWSLRCSLEGFSTVEYPAINVRSSRNVSIEVALAEAIGEVITVTSESPLLDERQMRTGTTVTQVELETIPTARDPWAIVSQTPGVMVDRINVGGNQSGQQSVFRAPGVSDDENAFLVDGVETTDMAAVGASPSYWDFDQFTEMQFTTGGSDVTKSAAGVSVNLVTKRGTNEFRGSARFLRTQNDFFNGLLEQEVPFIQQPDDRLAENQDGFVGNSVDKITDYGFEAGGPVLRDRLWFWGSFGNNEIGNLTGGRTPADVQQDRTVLENTALKFNWQIASPNSFVGSWNNGDKNKFGRSAGPTRPGPTTWDQRGPTAIYKFEDTHVFSSSFFLGGSWSKVDGGFSLVSKACIAAGSCADATETAWDANGVWQNSYLSGPSSRPSTEFKIDGSYFFNTGNTSHELKFGGRLRNFETQSTFHWPGRDLFTVDGGFWAGLDSPTIAVVARRGEDSAPVSQDYTSLWAQDTMQFGAFTVNVGFRYDLQEGQNDAYEIPGNPAFPWLLPAVGYQGADAGFDWSTIAPRIGATWALGPERKTLLRGSYSQFAEQLSSGNVNHINPLGYAYATFYYSDLNGNLLYDDGDAGWLDQGCDPVRPEGCLQSTSGFDPDNPTEAITANITDSGLDAPITQEFLLGVEHAFLPEFVVGLNYTYRITSDILSFEREMIDNGGGTRPALATDFVNTGTITATTPGGSFTQDTFAIGCGVGCRLGGNLQENTDRDVTYNGIALNFIKRLSNQWMMRGYINYGSADYSLSDDYILKYDPNDEELSFDNDGGLYSVQSAGSGAFGNAIIQSTWTWNLNGMYQIAPDRPWGFNVAANLFGREGTPLPYFYRYRDPLDRISRDMQVTGDIDDFRSDDVFSMDFRLEKEFAATSNVSFTFSWDIFNIFDESYALQKERRTNTSQYNWLRETLSPRIHRLGVRLSWR